MTTLSDVEASARVVLQDNTAPVRYSITECIAAINEALQAMYRQRPDLFLGQVSYATGLTARTGEQSILIPDQFRQALVDYVVFAMERSEEEFSADSRAAAFLKLFGGTIS